MKKIVFHPLWLCLSLGIFLIAALDAPGQGTLIYPPGFFETYINFGCNCSCSCMTNTGATNTPIGAFLADNGVSSITGKAMLADTNGGQYIPPHWALLDDGDLAFEGWTINNSVAAPQTNTTFTIAQYPSGPAGSFSFPPLGFVLYNDYEAPLSPLLGYDDSEMPEPFSGSPSTDQPYPWDVNVTLTLQNGQTYVMEQQLAVGPDANPYPDDGDWVTGTSGWGLPWFWGLPDITPITTNGEIPVVYDETNSLLSITAYCTYNGTNLLQFSGGTITAILLTNNIPAPIPIQPEDYATSLFTNWAWPLTPNDMPDTSGTIPGAAGTVQATLNLSGNTISNQLLLVRANRAYEIIFTYYEDYCGTNLQLVISNTGVLDPCATTSLAFYTTNCQCTNSVASYCWSTNYGNVAMLGTPNPVPGITVVANNYWNYDTLAAMGLFELPVQFPVNDQPYSVTKYAWETLGTNTAYEYFSSPQILVDELCEGDINLSNDFVICSNNPGIVQGNVFLTGPVDPGYFGGVPALSCLAFADYPGNPAGIPYDPPDVPYAPGGGQDLTLQNVSFVQATGGASPLSTSPPGGQADVEFDNPGGFFSENTYSGQYSLELGGLQSQPSVWNANDLQLVFTNPVNLAYNIYQTNQPYINITNLCGGNVVNDFSNCFGLVTENTLNINAGSGLPFTSVSIYVWGNGPGYTVGSALGPYAYFTDNNYLGTPDDASFQLFLPQGSYTYDSQATYYGFISVPLGNGVTLQIPYSGTDFEGPSNFMVGCESVGPTNSPCLQVDCPTNIVVTSCTNVPVYYPEPEVMDLCCTNWNAEFFPPSGSVFAPGTTNTVICQVSDNCGNTNICDFTVIVIEPSNCPPCLQVFSLQGNMDVSECTLAPVQFQTPGFTDACCTNVSVVFSPPSGTTLSYGVTTVTCVISDSCGNTNTSTFTVDVVYPGWQYCPGIIGDIGYLTNPFTLGTSTIGSSNMAIFWIPSGQNSILETTTNLISPNWVPVTNYVPLNGAVVPNNLPAQFYRLYSPTN